MMMQDLPKDPMLLLSVVNTKLRDFYENLDAFCEDLSVPKEEVISRLDAVGYTYDSKTNQFV